MGLEEKKRIKDIQDNYLPKFNGQLKDLGLTATYEMDFDSLKDSATGLNYVISCGLERVYDAVRVIAGDSVGKEALQEGLKKIVLRNVNESAQKKVIFSNGTLEVLSAWGTGNSDHFVSESDIKKAVEGGL